MCADTQNWQNTQLINVLIILMRMLVCSNVVLLMLTLVLSSHSFHVRIAFGIRLCLLFVTIFAFMICTTFSWIYECKSFLFDSLSLAWSASELILLFVGPKWNDRIFVYHLFYGRYRSIWKSKVTRLAKGKNVGMQFIRRICLLF